MCQFNNIILSKDANFEDASEVFKRHGFIPTQVHNNSLADQLKQKIFIISPKNQCDCGSVIASRNFQQDKELKELKSKGWSETKIRNYIASKARSDSHKIDSLEKERAKWGSLIEDILTSTKIRSFGILVHDYPGDISTEEIKIKSKNKIKLSEFSPEQLDSFKKDVLYEIEL